MFPTPTFTDTRFVLLGGTCNTLASAFISALQLINQAFYSGEAEIDGMVIGVTDIGGYWTIVVDFTLPNGPYAGESFFTGLDAPSDELLRAEYFTLPLSGNVKGGAAADPGTIDDIFGVVKACTQGAYNLILETCTDATDIEWSERVVEVAGLSAKRGIWTALCQTARGPLMACASGQVTDAFTLPGSNFTYGSDAPDTIGTSPLQAIIPMAPLVTAVDEITNQDAQISINQNAAAFSIKAKVVAT